MKKHLDTLPLPPYTGPMTMTSDARLVSTQPLPRQGLTLTVYYLPSPYGAEEEAIQQGRPSGYYTVVSTRRGEALSHPVGPYSSPAMAERAALHLDAAVTRPTHAEVVETARSLPWEHWEQAEQQGRVGIEDPTETTMRYWLLRDLLALMEAEGDALDQLVPEALADVEILKGVSTSRETPQTAPKSNITKDLA